MNSSEQELKKSSEKIDAASNPKLSKPARGSLLLLVLLASISTTNTYAQDSFQGMLSDLEGMERQTQTPSNPAMSLVQRLTNMEMRLFGAQRAGSMIDRLNALKSAMPAQGNQFSNTNIQNQSNSGFSQNQNPVERLPAPAAGNQSFREPQNFAPNNSNIGNMGAGETNKFHENLQAGQGWIPGNTNVSGSRPDTNGHFEGPSTVNTAATGMPAPPNMTPAPVKGWQPGVLSKEEKKTHKHSSGKQTQKQDDVFPDSNGARPNTAAANIPAGAQPLVSTPLPVPGAGIIKKNYAPDALPLLNGFPPNLVRMDADNTALIARPDYYDEVHKASKGKNIRYKNQPVPVYIQPFPDKAFVNCVLRAFESWEMRTNGIIKFVQTDNPNQARIQVVWKHLGGNRDGNGCLLGAHTILKYTNNGGGNLSIMNVGAVPVPIYIPRLGPKYTVPPQVMEVNLDLINSKEQSVKYPCLQNIVTHELGHALGMLGHSPNQTDIMYPVTDEHSRLSQRDINTVIKLYNQKCELPL